MADDLRSRILDATHDCIARVGISKTTLDDVAREAGCSRATLYRHFAGKQELLSSLVEREATRLQVALTLVSAGSDDLGAVCAAVMVEGAEFLLDHAALTAVLAIEPSVILPMLSLGGADEFSRVAAALLAPLVRRHLESDRDALRLADLLVRITISHLQSPDPARPITDPQVAQHVVDQYIVPGFAREPASGRTNQ
jgi:AcrR family transcriptional regulator